MAKPTALQPDDVGNEVWQDFSALRHAKRAPLTNTALSGIRKQAQLAGISLNEALTECCTRGWQSFKAEWVQPKPQAMSFADRDRQANILRWEQMTGRIHPSRNLITLEATPYEPAYEQITGY